MTRAAVKKYGRRKGGTYGRTHGPTRGNSKRTANKAVRRSDKLYIDAITGANPRATEKLIRGLKAAWYGKD